MEVSRLVDLLTENLQRLDPGGAVANEEGGGVRISDGNADVTLDVYAARSVLDVLSALPDDCTHEMLWACLSGDVRPFVTRTRYANAVSDGYGVRNERWTHLSEGTRTAANADAARLQVLLGIKVYIYCDFWGGGRVQTETGHVVWFEDEDFPDLAKALEAWNPNDE